MHDSTEPNDPLGPELFDFLLENVPDQIYFKDREGHFIRISKAVAEYLGAADTSEVIGKTDFEFWDEKTAVEAAADERRVMESGEPMVGKIEELVHPNGTVSWDYTSKLPLRNKRGEIIGICGINKDFTKVREMEDALREERNRLKIISEELRARNEQIEADLRMAREVQQALMPQHYRSIKKQNGRGAPTLSFSHCYIPALEVGGDFFHVFPLPNNRVGIFICDVMGHGVRAAMITALVRAVLEELRPRDLDAGEFMETVNKRLRSILVRVEEPFLATAFYAVADPAHSELRFANAGHPPSVRLRPGSGKCDLLAGESGKSGPGLGLFDEARYPTETSAFEMGDRVVFYTDGAFEVDSPTGEEFGKEALLAEFGKYSNLPAADLFAAVLDDVKRFSERSEFDDDVCLVVCERTSS